jgi:hypothetical protein
MALLTGRVDRGWPWGAPWLSFFALSVAVEQVFIQENRVPQALKRGHTMNELVARVELMPFPTLRERRISTATPEITNRLPLYW